MKMKSAGFLIFRRFNVIFMEYLLLNAVDNSKPWSPPKGKGICFIRMHARYYGSKVQFSVE